ncbi:hypothetical protein SO802_031112 [Lithocarpus litseifolius]|uniref:Uncharacterized protein n=1 Tax=Lithocarpus litseifolius TaxID=425828 RepID=A0AAW2BJB4_9ROSI
MQRLRQRKILNTEDSEDEDDEDDEMEDEEFHVRYCVICSKLDISRKRVMMTLCVHAITHPPFLLLLLHVLHSYIIIASLLCLSFFIFWTFSFVDRYRIINPNDGGLRLAHNFNNASF